MRNDIPYKTPEPNPTTLSVSSSWMAKLAPVGVFCPGVVVFVFARAK
jgi:hypothetical protein